MARIMVVNDTQEILDLFRGILTDEGHDVYLYSYTPQSLMDVEQVKPDLLILDYIVGREELGWQMLQKLKMNRSTEAIPVIICTTVTKFVQEIEGFLTAKGIGLVPKPFNIDDLVLAVNKTLEHKQQTTSPNARAEQ